MRAEVELTPAPPITSAEVRQAPWQTSAALIRRLDWVEWSVLVLFFALSLWVMGLDLHQQSVHGGVWTGTDGVYVVDQMQYLAWISSASHHFLSSNLYVLRHTPADYFMPAVTISAGLTALGVAPWLTLLLWKPVAVRTEGSAGRVCSATPSGIRTVVSELASATGLLRGLGDRLQRLAGRRGHGGGDGALHEGGVGQPDAPVDILLEHVADGEDRAAQVGQHHHAATGVGTPDGLLDAVGAGAQAALRVTAGGLDPDIGPRHLTGHRGQPSRELRAVGDQYNADQPLHLSQSSLQ